MSAELDEIWTLYADDGAQSLDVMEQSLLSLKENPEQAEHIAALFRSIHTFKGNARVLGLAAIEACAHASEDLVGLVRDENVPLDADLIALLLDAGDVLRAMMNDSLARRADPSPEGSSDLIGRIKAKIAQCRAKQREMSEPQAIIFEPVERKTLAQDSLYLEIFQSMAAETLEEARKLRPSWQAGEAADCRQLFAGVERLAFAAAQIGKAAWAEDLSKFLASGVLTVAKFYALIAKIESFMSGGCQAEAPERAPAEPQDASAGLLDAPSLPVTGLAALIGESAKLEMPAVAAGRSMLAADDTYRAIFFDMVSDILREMQAALGEFEADPKLLREALAQRAGRLLHASEQIGMPGWLDLLSEFAGRPEVTAEEARDFVAKLEALALKNGEAAYAVAEEACAGDPIRRFFDNLPAQLATVSTYGGLLSSGRPVDADAFFAAAAQIREMAEELGFVRIADIAGQIACEREFSAFRRLELRLFEELAAVEQSAPSQLAGAALVPGAVLQNWCADQAFDALIELSHSLDEMHKEPGSTPCDGVIELFRLIYHACRHYHMETAAHLSMSLIDLFSRARDDRTPPDPMLLRISRSFSADLEILLDTAGSGGTPDMALIERLFEEAANVTFTANGTISSSIIESRLGLPKSFRKVLTPESLKTAAAAMNQGLQFYIVRAALNGDEKIAGGFLDWINSGTASVVSNVTVFDGADTLFDFLLATPLGESELAESLATLDPKGAALKIEMVLNRSGAAQRGAQEAGKRPGNEVNGSVHKPAAQDLMPRDMLEGIGEIVTGHAMIYRTLGDLVSEDIARTVEAEVRRSGGDWTKAKDAVRAALEAFTARIERAYQAEAQLSTQLERLQEEAIAVRSRPAALLTKPLEAFAESVARENGRRIKMDVGGNDELVLDHAMLEELKPHLRSLLTFCVTRSIEEPDRRTSQGKDACGRVRLSLARSDDRVLATLEDDGLGFEAIPGEDADALFSETRTALRSQGGDLRVESPSGGGIRFHLMIPMAMVVLDGMVVRVGEFRYVVPLEAVQRIVHSGFQDVMRVSADGGRHMLKLGQEDVLPVHFLKAAANGGGSLDRAAAQEQMRLFVVVGKQSQRVALLVDELMGQQLVLIRPLRGYLTGIRGVTGCALLGGGDVGMVLDIGQLLVGADQG